MTLRVQVPLGLLKTKNKNMEELELKTLRIELPIPEEVKLIVQSIERHVDNVRKAMGYDDHIYMEVEFFKIKTIEKTTYKYKLNVFKKEGTPTKLNKINLLCTNYDILNMYYTTLTHHNRLDLVDKTLPYLTKIFIENTINYFTYRNNEFYDKIITGEIFTKNEYNEK